MVLCTGAPNTEPDEGGAPPKMFWTLGKLLGAAGGAAEKLKVDAAPPARARMHQLISDAHSDCYSAGQCAVVLPQCRKAGGGWPVEAGH